MPFRWNEWNTQHIAAHGVDPDEAEIVVTQAKRPYPQVIYILDEDGTIYIIHARPMTDREKRRYRRKRRG